MLCDWNVFPAQNEETRAFYDTYHQDLIDLDDEFGYLRRDAAMPPDDGNVQAEEPQETVSMDEIRRRVREVVENDYVSTTHMVLRHI